MEKRMRSICSEKEIEFGEKHSCPTDRISQLPDDLLVFILSHLTFNEATATSILSRRWRRVWTFLRRLDFDGTRLLLKVESEKFEDRDIVLDKARCNYVRWIDHVIASHQWSDIEEFRVFFILNKAYEKSIDEWLRYALASRNIQNLELNLTDDACRSSRRHDEIYTFPYKLVFDQEKGTFRGGDSIGYKYLKKLCMNYVNVNGETLEFFLRNCPLLEHLSVSQSQDLTSLKIIGPFPSFKWLEISRCFKLDSVEIRDANLVHLKYKGKRIPFLLENVPLLVEIFIGGPITYNLEDIVLMLSSYLPQLEIFKISNLGNNFTWEETKRFYSSVKMSKLKQFWATVFISHDESLMWVTNLIRASHCLEKVVLKVMRDEPKFVKRKLKKIATPYIHLKEFKFIGYCGAKSDLELVMHCLENASSLEKVVVDPRGPCVSTLCVHI